MKAARAMIMGNSSGILYGTYTSAWYAQVLVNGGSATTNELTYLTTFENAVGSDLSKFDILGILGLSNIIAARTSFVNPSRAMLTLVNSPTFTAGEGFTGNGSTMYIDTNYDPVTDGVNYSIDDCSIFAYTRINQVSTGVVLGAISATGRIELYPRYSGNVFYNSLNSVGFGGVSNSDSRGYFSVSRADPSNKNSRINTSSTVEADATNAVPNRNIYLLGGNNMGTAGLFVSNQLSAYGFGKGSINQGIFRTALQNLGTNLLWAV